MASQFTLGKNERLKSRKAIDFLFANGRKKSVAPFRVVYDRKNTKGLLLGVSASAKNFSRATDRNLLKRRVREAWRLQKQQLAQTLEMQGKGMHVFIICTSNEMPDYNSVTVAVQKIIVQLLKEIEQG